MSRNKYCIIVYPEDLENWCNFSQRKAYRVMEEIREKLKLSNRCLITRIHLSVFLEVTLKELDKMIYNQILYSEIMKRMDKDEPL